MTAYERLVDALRAHGRDIKDSGAGRAQAQCPAHDDNCPSLSVGPRRDGQGVVVHCHAGCPPADVLSALGLSMRDLFDDDDMGAVYAPKRDYHYPDGRVVHRKPDKSFPQSGKTKGNSLFRADRVGDAEIVYVVEGEKDVEAIELAGGAAVCSAMGAGKARLADWSPLRGKHAVVVADKDDPGRKHAAEVARLLEGVAASMRLVEAAAGKDAADHVAADKTLDEFRPVVDAEDHPVDGAELLDDIERFAGPFLALPSAHHMVVLCLWVVHTWCVGAFYVTPRLVLDSPEPGSGKTRVLELLALLCCNAKLTLSTTTAALYRRIAAAGDNPPTILQDEADAVWGRTTNPQAEDLRALYNAGYKRGATVDRCEGDAKNMRVVEFPVFAPAALAGLAGKMPRTIIDRAAAVFHMRRRAPNEHIAEFRERDAAIAAAPLRARIERWGAANFDALEAARPEMPEGVRDRPAECWEALLAVADVAGGDWPERARAACRHFTFDSDPDELSFGARLLRDVLTVFGDHDRMFSADIVTALVADDESEWSDLWGKPLDQKRLAKELKRYGVRSNTIRIGEGRAKGYQVDGDDGLGQAWRRYLPDAPMRDNRYHRDIAGQSVTDKSGNRDNGDIRDASVTTEMPFDQPVSDGVTGVTVVTHIDGMLGAVLFDDSPRSTDEDRRCGCGNRLTSPEARGASKCKPCRDKLMGGYAS